nr:putative integron gene cassette protein [uncultured bacterium]
MHQLDVAAHLMTYSPSSMSDTSRYSACPIITSDSYHTTHSLPDPRPSTQERQPDSRLLRAWRIGHRRLRASLELQSQATRRRISPPWRSA